MSPTWVATANRLRPLKEYQFDLGPASRNTLVLLAETPGSGDDGRKTADFRFQHHVGASRRRWQPARSRLTGQARQSERGAWLGHVNFPLSYHSMSLIPIGLKHWHDLATTAGALPSPCGVGEGYYCLSLGATPSARIAFLSIRTPHKEGHC